MSGSPHSRAAALPDAELVAIQLGTGGRDESALALAQALLSEWDGVAGLAGAAVDELARRRGVGPATAARHGRLRVVAASRPAQESMLRSLVGFEQQMSTLFRAISRGRMPPWCCMSTVPDRIVVLQVPHMPWLQDDGGFRPAA